MTTTIATDEVAQFLLSGEPLPQFHDHQRGRPDPVMARLGRIGTNAAACFPHVHFCDGDLVAKSGRAIDDGDERRGVQYARHMSLDVGGTAYGEHTHTLLVSSTPTPRETDVEADAVASRYYGPGVSRGGRTLYRGQFDVGAYMADLDAGVIPTPDESPWPWEDSPTFIVSATRYDGERDAGMLAESWVLYGEFPHYRRPDDLIPCTPVHGWAGLATWLAENIVTAEVAS